MLNREARPKEKTAFLGREDPGAMQGNWRSPEEALTSEQAKSSPILQRGSLSTLKEDLFTCMYSWAGCSPAKEGNRD